MNDVCGVCKREFDIEEEGGIKEGNNVVCSKCVRNHPVLFSILIGVVLGQHSVWKDLRKKGEVKIDKWRYTAVKMSEGRINKR